MTTTIDLLVSKKKNAEHLEKLTDDPAFIVSILKNMGYKELPDQVNVRIRIAKPKKDEETKD